MIYLHDEQECRRYTYGLGPLDEIHSLDSLVAMAAFSFGPIGLCRSSSDDSKRDALLK